jgi:uncharacterized damage-inducible protein DinB
MDADARATLLLAYAQGPEQLRQALSAVPPDVLDLRPAAGAWSVREVVAHVAEMELHLYLRTRFALAQPGLTILPFDQDAWAASFEAPGQPLDELVALIRLLREMLARQLRRLPEAQWVQSVRHPEQERPLTVEALIAKADQHLKIHLAQIARTARAAQG